MKMILDLFAGGHSVTVLKDDGITSASASATSDVQKDAEVTLTVTAASGYVIKEYETLTGGVTVDPATKKFVMGEKDVQIIVRSRKSGSYLVTEETMVNVNDNPIRLHANEIIELTKNGVPKAITAASETDITDSDAVQSLIAQEILIPI